MNVADDEHQLETFLTLAADVNPDHPVVITKFVTGAKEQVHCPARGDTLTDTCLRVELDAVAQDGKLINWAIAEHIEHAGVHSGDATMVLPAHDLPTSVQEEVKLIGTKIATALNINGPCNIQFLLKDNVSYNKRPEQLN
jgi:carbamoylphosphate synthase large subunit